MTHKHSCQPSSVKQGLQLVLHQSFWQVTSPNLHALVFYLGNLLITDTVLKRKNQDDLSY